MRHHLATLHERGHLQPDPGWVSILLAPLVLLTGTLAVLALLQYPALLGGIAAGLLLRPAVRAGRRLARHPTTDSHSSLSNPAPGSVARGLTHTE